MFAIVLDWRVLCGHVATSAGGGFDEPAGHGERVEVDVAAFGGDPLVVLSASTAPTRPMTEERSGKTG